MRTRYASVLRWIPSARGLPGRAVVEDRPEGRQPFPHARRAPAEQRLEQRGRLHPIVGQAAQRREQPIRGQAVGARDARRLGETLRRVERGARRRLRGGRPPRLVERLATGRRCGPGTRPRGPRSGGPAGRPARARRPRAAPGSRSSRGGPAGGPRTGTGAPGGSPRGPARRGSAPDWRATRTTHGGPSLGSASPRAPRRGRGGPAPRRSSSRLSSGRDALRGDGLEVARRPLAEQHEPARGRRLAGGAGERHALAAGQRPGEVGGHGGRRVGDVGRGVERERVRPPPLERDRPAEEPADRRRSATPRRGPPSRAARGRPRAPTAWRSSSPRRSTRKPMSRRSSAAGSQAVDADRRQPGVRGRLAERGERVCGLAGGRVRAGRGGRGTRSSPEAPLRASVWARSTRSAGRGATTASELAGTMTRSAGSSTSSAGTRARSTRTQPTPRASSAVGDRRADRGGAGQAASRGLVERGHRGKCAARGGCVAWRCAPAGAQRAPDGGAGGRESAADRRGLDQVVEHRAELPRHVDVAVRADRRARAARRRSSRAQTRRRGIQNVISSPTIRQPERRPHEALARVPLRDQEREVAEPAQLDREVRPLGRRGLAAGQRERLEADDLPATRRRSRPTARNGSTSSTPVPVVLALEQQLERDVAAGHGELGEREARGLLGHRDRAGPQRLAVGVADHDVRRRPEAVLVERVAADRRAGR